MTLLHHACVNNYEAVKKLTLLPYFDKLIIYDDNDEEWTPLMWGVSQSKADLRIVELFKSRGCDLLKRKRSDGFSLLHIAACSNDV